MSESEAHIKTLRLFDIARDDLEVSEEERNHLAQCEECTSVIVVFARQFRRQKPQDKGNAA